MIVLVNVIKPQGLEPLQFPTKFRSHSAHAAQTIDWFMDGAFRPAGFDLDFDAHERAVRGDTSLTDARAWFTRAVENARSVINTTSTEEWTQPIAEGPVMGGSPRSAIFGAITDHTAHHRGALTIYARLRNEGPSNALHGCSVVGDTLVRPRC